MTYNLPYSPKGAINKFDQAVMTIQTMIAPHLELEQLKLPDLVKDNVLILTSMLIDMVRNGMLEVGIVRTEGWDFLEVMTELLEVDCKRSYMLNGLLISLGDYINDMEYPSHYHLGTIEGMKIAKHWRPIKAKYKQDLQPKHVVDTEFHANKQEEPVVIYDESGEIISTTYDDIPL